MAKTKVKTKVLSINKLNDYERAFYQEVMEEVLEEHGISRDLPMLMLKERMKKKKSDK
ncbi:hypothetical protein [Mycoplasma sp. Ms02]|uniref:hypothetical protein n=1 Tax=Mycoplasma sp. Ms02 TaxID=353851 RepID=UPI001C893835|nr:hypothetical protein [Mycoplasma sp. Ms02]QZE12608.1 hypothetical protein K4L35_01320 [Mycoplasma sp. Ms02]